jgi:membrane-associated HD superfamily phosphohydrolase
MNIKNVFDDIARIERQVQENLITRASTDVYNLILLNEHFVKFNPSYFRLDNYINSKKLKTTIYIKELHSNVIIGKLIVIEQNKLRVIYNALRLPKGSRNHEANQEAQNLLAEYITSNQFDDANKQSHLVTQLSDDIRMVEINPTKIILTKIKFYTIKSLIWLQALLYNSTSSFLWIISGGRNVENVMITIFYYFFTGLFGLMTLPSFTPITLMWGIPLSIMALSALILGLNQTIKTSKNNSEFFCNKPKYFFKNK